MLNLLSGVSTTRSPEDDVPIDIQYQKLIEALVDRKIIPMKWSEELRKTRTLIPPAVKELKTSTSFDSTLESLLSSHPESPHYFTCQDILKHLEKIHKGGAVKNFFGQYTSDRLAQWDHILKSYERNNVYLGELARLVIQQAAHEIPLKKKTIQSNEKQVADNHRKMQEYQKSIQTSKHELAKMCADLGIQAPKDDDKNQNQMIDSRSFREQLEALVSELPTYFLHLSDRICAEPIEKAEEYYVAMQEYLHSVTPASFAESSSKSSKSSKSKSSKSKSSNSSSLEIISNQPTEMPAIQKLRHARRDTTDGQDHTIPVDAESGMANPTEDQVHEIQWDITTSVSVDETTSESPSMDDEIDWNISTVEASDSVRSVEEENPTTSATPKETNSRCTWMRSMEFRNQLKNNILELQAYLLQRAVELCDGDASAVVYANQFQHSSNAKVLIQTRGDLQDWMDELAEILVEFNNPRFHQLLMIESSPRFLDRLVATLVHKVKQETKLRLLIAELEDRNVKLVASITQLSPEIPRLISSTKRLKTTVRNIPTRQKNTHI